jgi:hypothetical protein
MISDIISKLSFDNYIVVDCLVQHSNKINIIALSEESFVKVYYEIIDVCTLGMYSKHFSSNCVVLTVNLNVDNNLSLDIDHDLSTLELKIYCTHQSKETIRKSLEQLVIPKNSGLDSVYLDLQKCYYDCTQMYCAPETVRCLKSKLIKNVFYVWDLYSVIQLIKLGFDFTVEFWELNKQLLTEVGRTNFIWFMYNNRDTLCTNFKDSLQTPFKVSLSNIKSVREPIKSPNIICTEDLQMFFKTDSLQKNLTEFALRHLLTNISEINQT